ncbi:hypothetical protein [Candidatus Hodarchaeum mangrovi]
MQKRLILFSKDFFALVLILFTFTILINPLDHISSQTDTTEKPIRIVQTSVPWHGGMNSIQAITESSMIGILYRNNENPAPLYLVTDFSQKLASVEIFTRQGTLYDRTILQTRNTFAIQILNLVEFEDKNENGIFDRFNETVLQRRIDLSQVIFNVQTSQSVSEENQLVYQLELKASNVDYERISQIPYPDKLEELSFSFNLEVILENVKINEIPNIKIQPKDREVQITCDFQNKVINAIKLTPRLKFSCNINGWDFLFPRSKLFLELRAFSNEEILTSFKALAGMTITRQALKQTNLLSRLQFNATRTGIVEDINLDHNKNQTVDYSDYLFSGSKFSLRSTFREFLQFSWVQDTVVDNNSLQMRFQLLETGEIQARIRPQSNNTVSAIFIRAGFIFPQGLDIFYDPELSVEEINPLITIFAPPNRSLLQPSSILMLSSGFVLGILIIIRQVFRR